MDTAQDVTQFIAAFLKQAPDKVRPELELTALVKESFVLIQMVVEMQESLKVRLVQDDLAKVKTVGQLIEAVARKRGG
jgi:acyl carrier protein